MKILDFITAIIVFIGLLCVGYISSRKVKKAEDFLLAGRRLNCIQAAFSVAASDFGGSGLIGACALCYTVGLSGAWWDWCAAPAFLILGIFLVKRLRPLAVATAPQFLEMRYDRKTRVFATLMQLCSIIPSLSAQFLVGAISLNTMLGIPKIWGLCISVVLVLSYTAVGGLTAVANTDVYNFCILIGSVMIAVPLMLIKGGGISTILTSVPQSFISISELGVMKPLSWIFLCIFMYGTQQVYLQRVFASKNAATARFAYIFTSISYVIYGLLVALIGMSMSVLMPGLEDPNTAYAMMLKHYLPTGLTGIGLGGIFAASLSTADSTLLAGATLFVNDIYIPFIKKKASDNHILLISRLATLLICIGGILVANIMENLIDIVYLGGLFYSAAVFFPIILGVYWKRANATGAFAAIFAAFIIGLYTEYVAGGALFGIPSNMIAASAAIIVQIIVSLCTMPPQEEKLKCIIINQPE